ncbi:dihydroxyacetone kinase subunit DhaK [Mycetocola spongiae]|uniref:dihydroxyacetone kinase subunit DhaK n=1 Tax=Mycetocola spongiae TaxID=2859226 RepID=UPI001CF3172F|nr:dihydroxyacetone kinase subunit DhaK [Mycetocola spongiae]UCR89756.1 dihydroxyacetone kinase subunit DhaK [Mycetocola spongiae]
MKKFMNDPRSLVTESLAGYVRAHSDLLRAVPETPAAVRRAGSLPGTVAVISGGGSGHEPLPLGFIGEGMLAAGVCGEIFSSPTPDAIIRTARMADSGAGVLFLVNNYTGDVMNFEIAAELLAGFGIEVRTVLADDDAALDREPGGPGRRGIMGIVVAAKIAGAAAERGEDLDAVAALARDAVARTATVGVGLRAGILPLSGRPSFDVGETEMEVGIGIHGEPGRERRPVLRVDDLLADLLAPSLAALAPEPGADLILIVNGLGATPLAELSVLSGAADRALTERGFHPARGLLGNYVTSLDMQGASISLFRADSEMLGLWDAPVHTPALSWGQTR